MGGKPAETTRGHFSSLPPESSSLSQSVTCWFMGVEGILHPQG